jgi:hypothetical protein
MSIEFPWHTAFRRALGLPPTATVDAWHHQTVQPDPGAMSYAFDHFGLFFVSPIASGDRNRLQWQAFSPYDYHSQQLAIYGLGGVQQGTSRLTALLISQSDAVTRGLANAPGTGPIPNIGG